jgi:hypothetical protein
MKHRLQIPLLFLLAAALHAQDTPLETRYSIAVINDATFYNSLRAPIPAILNQSLIEPTFSLRYQQRWTLFTSLISDSITYSDTATAVRVREAYVGLSAGNLDLTAGRKLARWGTGYAFTAAGVLDPPRVATNPSDRLNLNQGRDMIKADYVHSPHAFALAWSTAAFAPAGSNLQDTTAFRYNVLVHGFDTALIAGDDRGGDSFGALTFTRVLGDAWELHGEAAWREHEAILLGAKYTMHSGVTFIGEFFTPPNIPYYRDANVSPTANRQHYAFLNASKSRLRELPGWKEWDLSGSIVMNLNDHSYVGVFDVNRWFGKHVSAYVHAETPVGSKTSDYGSAPYSASTSLGLRFQL